MIRLSVPPSQRPPTERPRPCVHDYLSNYFMHMDAVSRMPGDAAMTPLGTPVATRVRPGVQAIKIRDIIGTENLGWPPVRLPPHHHAVVRSPGTAAARPDSIRIAAGATPERCGGEES